MGQVATTILQQLGGNKFIAMTGAKNFGSIEKGLSFKIGRNSSGYNHVKIVLNSLDLYDMHFIKVRKCRIVKDDEVCGLYDDMLQRTFTDKTGLYTHL